MAFVLVGLLIAHASAPRQDCWNRMARDPAYRRLYGYALVAIGLGSYFYHASLTFAGQVCDMSGMYLLITFALLYGVARRTEIRSVAVIPAYVGLNVILLGFQIAFPDLRRYVFGLLVLVVVGMESRYRHQPGVTIESKWLLRGAAIMALAFFIWVLDITEVACDPANPLQGHAVWHMLSAVAGWSLYRYYRSECTIPSE
jgi:Ceramidase